MPQGSRRTSYVRDARGRFASTPGGAPKRPPTRRVSRGTNRLTRDNSGRITSVGGNGATARGGRLRTGAGRLRATQTDRLKRAPLQGVVSRSGKARVGVASVVKHQRSVKLSASQRAVAQLARDNFNDPTLLLNGRIAKSHKEAVAAIQQKFGVDNRIATLAFMRRGFRMGTSDIQYIDTARTKKTIKALRATTALGLPIGGRSRKAKGAAVPGTVSRRRQKPAAASRPGAKALRVIRIPRQANRIGLPKMPREAAKALQPFLRDLPTVPTKRKPDYVQAVPGGKLQTFYLSNEQPRRASANQIASLKKAMSGWTHRASGLGHSQTYSRIFNGVGGANELLRVTITRKGGPLVGGQIEVTRSVTSRGGRRGGGSLVERAVGLPQKPRISSTPRRRKPKP